jgi:mannose/fructose-specific phosphotransferase system component IIA
MVNHGKLAAELLNDAKQVHGNPSRANTLALIGIGNALLQIAEQLGRLDRLSTMVGSLDEFAHRP